jgi:predicted Zn-ribbon and HTH transcriptional regulator
MESQGVDIDYYEGYETWSKRAKCPKCKMAWWGLKAFDERVRMIRVYIKKMENRKLMWQPVGFVCPKCGFFVLDPDVKLPLKGPPKGYEYLD